ncbi:MAG TPA: PepSY-associated TM helix domain-containing protein [Methylocella sp.]|nr:PepSY-associated TM helix domain-containing protein [Methylocella sp.]
MIRRFWVFIHRWTGLLMAGFLLIVGLTGSLLAFLPELDRAINPGLFATERPEPRLTPGDIAARAEALVPGARVHNVNLGDPGRAEVYVAPRGGEDGESLEPGFNLLYLDPYTGQELGRTNWGEITQGFSNLMSFIYKLHFELAMGMWGVWILGITALVWTLDCFVGFYLTLPAKWKVSAGQGRHDCGGEGAESGWWTRWMVSWKIKWKSSAYRINFDLHRAGGLWLWAVLLIFAWSSVYMNLWDTVYTWATRAVLEYKAPWTELPGRENSDAAPRLGWLEAQAAGDKLMAEQAQAHGFRVEAPVSLSLDSERGVYAYTVRSSLDIQDKRGKTQLFFDSDTGAFRLLLLPTGQYAGNTVTSWLYALHMANVFGLPWRIFVCLTGLVIAMLSVTGVYIWWKKRRARKVSAARRKKLEAACPVATQHEEVLG